MHNIISVLLIAAMSTFCISTLSSQAVKETVKVVVIEKSIDENGNVTESKVIKEGDEAKKYLKENEISGGKNSWTTDEGKVIDIDGADIKIIKNKKVKMIKKNDNGTEEIMEWEGEGEMPEDIKEALEEHDIDIISDEKDNEIKVTVDSDDKSSETKIKIFKSHNGDEEDIEIEMDGEELSDEMKQMLEEQGINLQIIKSDDGEHKTITVVTEEDQEINTNKAQLGVYLIDNDMGIEIDDIVEGSSAQAAGLQKGDIITAIDDTAVSSMDKLVEAIGRYDIGDVVLINYIRNNKNESKEVTLRARQDTDNIKNVEKYIIIEKDK